MHGGAVGRRFLDFHPPFRQSRRVRRILLLALAVLAMSSNLAEACSCSSSGPDDSTLASHE
jgi:hypothetical protein